MNDSERKRPGGRKPGLKRTDHSDALRAVVKATGLTQREIALILGVNYDTLRRWVARVDSNRHVNAPLWAVEVLELRLRRLRAGDVTQNQRAPNPE